MAWGSTVGAVRGRRAAAGGVLGACVLLTWVCSPHSDVTGRTPSARPPLPAVASSADVLPRSVPAALPAAPAAPADPTGPTGPTAPELVTDRRGAPERGASGSVGCTEQVLARLTPAQRAGQVIMIGVPADAPASGAAAVRLHHPGGVFLRGRSARPLADVRRQVDALQRAAGPGGAVPLHVAVDQEGGQVQTLRGPGLGRMPSALVQGGWPRTALRARTTAWARTLRGAGVTMNLAPVADTVPGDPRRNPPIGAVDRQFGRTPQAVAEHVAVVTGASRQAGVVVTLKHFPGLGRVRANTDVSTAAVDAGLRPGDPLLRPFAAGIEAGAGAVMLSSARYPALDPRQPAVFSPRVVALLRSELRFDGVVVSDDLGAAAAVRHLPVGRRAVAFVAAGGDLVLTVRTQDAAPMGAALVAAAKSSPQFRDRLDDAVRHVLGSKAEAGLLRC